ncbi:MAG: hypothetical protein ACLS9K_03745 [Lachnospira eligens]
MTLDYSATLVRLESTVHNGVNHFNGEQALALQRRYAYSDRDRQKAVTR